MPRHAAPDPEDPLTPPAHEPAPEPDEPAAGEPPARPPVEAKVKAAGAAGGVFAVLLTIAAYVASNGADLAALGLPAWAITAVAGAASVIVAVGAAYRAEHTPRPDLETKEPGDGG